MDLLAGFVVLVFFIVMLVVPIAVVVLIAVTVSRRRKASMAPALAQPLSAGDSERVSQMLAQGQKIHAVRLVREATGLSLADAKYRVDHWWDPPHAAAPPVAQAAPRPRAGGVDVDERLRIEASAILATSGWHTAEAFLREQRGLTPESAKALLDSLG